MYLHTWFGTYKVTSMPKAAKVTQITVPLTTLSVGIHGPFSSGDLPSTLVGYQVDLINDASWPTTGGDAVLLAVEQSNDGGQSWAFDASITLAAAAWADRHGAVVHTSTWDVQLDNQGATQRRVRITATVFQACKLGATVSSV